MSMRQITLDIPEQLAAALTGLVIVTEKFLALRAPWRISSAILPRRQPSFGSWVDTFPVFLYAEIVLNCFKHKRCL